MAYIYDLTDTWNAGGTTFNAIKMNVTDSASAAGSKLVTLQTNGTEHFSVTKAGVGYFSGNVGIGTSSPPTYAGYSNLAIEGANGATLQLRNSAGTNIGELASAPSEIYFKSILTTPLWFGTSNTERMRIDGSGNVGIGTSSPGYKLEVRTDGVSEFNWITSFNNTAAGGYGAGFIARSGSNFGYFYMRGDGTAYVENAGAFPLGFATSGTERMRIDGSGNVGIGTTTPTTILQGSYSSSCNGLAIAGAIPTLALYDSSGTTGTGYLAQLDTTTALYNKESGPLTFGTNNTERMRIDASGNVGIGTSSPATTLAVNGQTRATSLDVIGSLSSFAATGGLTNYYNGAGVGVIRAYSDGAGAAGTLTFNASGSENMRIDSSGNLLWGKSSTANEVTTDGAILYKNASGGGSTAYFTNGGSGTAMAVGVQADASAIQFFRSGSSVGSISLTTTATSYNTSSDYRLKDIDGPITNSGAYIDALKPVQGSWKADGSRFIGLLAHEVQEVSETPIATGEKDGEEMQAMDYSAPEIIANLIAEIQSLRARVAQLEGN